MATNLRIDKITCTEMHQIASIFFSFLLNTTLTKHVRKIRKFIQRNSSNTDQFYQLPLRNRLFFKEILCAVGSLVRLKTTSTIM